MVLAYNFNLYIYYIYIYIYIYIFIYIYFGNNYKDSIDNIFNCGLKEKYLLLTRIDNRIIDLKNIVDRYQQEKDIDVIEEEFNFDKPSKTLATIDDKINTVVENYESKTKVEI